MSKQNPEEGHLQGCKNKNTHIWGVIMEKTENRFKLARTAYNQHGKQSVKTVSKETNPSISKSLIDDLESNVGKKRAVSYLTVKQLAQYYGVTSDYLLGLSDIPCLDTRLQAVNQVTGLSVDAIIKLSDLKDNDPVLSDIVSLLLEDKNCLYFLSLIHSLLKREEEMVELDIAGKEMHILNKNLLAAVLQTKLVENLNELSKTYDAE